MLSFTFDTQCLRYLDPEHPTPAFRDELRQLLHFAEQGLIDAAYVGLIVDKDLATAPRREEWRERITALPIDDVPGVAVLGEWVLGRDVLASDEAAEVLDGDELPSGIDHRDRLHLHAHRAHQRDIFVTNDRDILSVAGTLASAGIIVMRPDEALRAAIGVTRP